MSDKYPSTSPYTYCGNNPVKLVDPNGEDIWIIGEDGNRYRYENGIIYDINKNIVSNVDKSTSTIVTALNRISESKMGNIMISELQKEDGPYNVTIGLSSDKSKYHSTGTAYKDGQFLRHTDGKVSWNPDTKVPIDDGSQLGKSELFGLAHELSHAYDDCIVNPLTNFPESQRGPGTNANRAAESFAMLRENCVRSDLGGNLRSHYEIVGNNMTGFRGGGMRAINPIMLSVQMSFLGYKTNY